MGTILVVNQDDAILALYEKSLTDAGHQVVRSLDGQDALHKLANEKFDLIITDPDIPKVSGQEFIESLLREESVVSCPIIILSTSLDVKFTDKVIGQVRMHFLAKSVSIKDLVAKVSEALSAASLKSKIDVRFINPVLGSTMQVITELTQFTVNVGKPYLKHLGEVSGDISGIVEVVSPGFKGSISLSFSESGFLKVLSKMLSIDCKGIDEENKEAVGELLNIIFGRAKKILNESGMNIQPAFPSVVFGKSHSVEHCSLKSVIVIPYISSEIGSFRSEISIKS